MDVIISSVTRSANALKKAFCLYDPTVEGRLPAERNLSHAFAGSYCRLDSSSSALYEIPFDRKNNSSKLDVLLLNERVGVLVETKKVGKASGRKLEQILKDRKRLLSARAYCSRKCQGRVPRRWFGLILVLFKTSRSQFDEYWMGQQTAAAKSTESKKRMRRISRRFVREGWVFGEKAINSDYKILYAYKKL
jgi:hypothetical protein